MTADKTIAPDAAAEETFTLTNNKTGDTYELPVMHAYGMLLMCAHIRQ